MTIVRRLLLSWLACASAFFLLTLTPIATASSWQTVIAISTLWWIFGSLIYPILKVLLLPFNIISLGLIGGVVQFLCLWIIFWIIPGFHLHAFTIYGLTISGGLLFFVVAFAVSLFQTFLMYILDYIFP